MSSGNSDMEDLIVAAISSRISSTVSRTGQTERRLQRVDSCSKQSVLHSEGLAFGLCRLRGETGS